MTPVKRPPRSGHEAELLAEKFLRSLRYRVIARNFATPAGEIDLIARDGNVLAFIEVRARSSESFGRPAETVTVSKQRKIVKAAAFFLGTRRLGDIPVRFDIVAVNWTDDQSAPRMELTKDAFQSRI